MSVFQNRHVVRACALMIGLGAATLHAERACAGEESEALVQALARVDVASRPAHLGETVQRLASIGPEAIPALRRGLAHSHKRALEICLRLTDEKNRESGSGFAIEHAGVHAEMARAYHGLGDATRARLALDRARLLTPSDEDLATLASELGVPAPLGWSAR